MVLTISFMFLVLYTYIFYPVILALMAASKRQGNAVGHEKSGEFYPHVSMIISAYNEEVHIREKIDNFLALNYPKEKSELLIGSDGSTDKTVSCVRSFVNERIKLFEFPKRRGKVSILNDIAGKAKGSIIIFSDADTMYDKDSVKFLVRHFDRNDVGGVCGRLLLRQTASSLAEEGLYWKYENFIKEMESRIKTIVGINGQIFAIRRELFEPLPEDTITEDQALGMRILGRCYNILFDRDAIASEAIGSFREEFKRRVRISAGNFQSIAPSKAVLNPKMGFASFALWSHKILRWLAPFFLIAIFTFSLFSIKTPFFKLLLLSQIIFYLLSLPHYVLTKLGIRISALETIQYFNLMNLAILIGFFKFLTKTQKVTWEMA